ncbi:unnamed protein product [Soboliphyme baturini]|uniref:proteasome endopeptidase complex n=1 Tax=Soboliphyme baturini TaxID=241478 RepID=A0A183J058_9BILA|nr:unnamed protein product [Soboliphyme baturini]
MMSRMNCGYIDDTQMHMPYGKLSDGTTLVAAEFQDGVVIGTDSRTSMGSLIVGRVTDKITEITPFICCLRSGSAADTQAVTDIVKYMLEVYEMEHNCVAPVFIAAQMFRDMCYRYREQLSAGILVCGWDQTKGGQVYSVPLGGMIVRQSMGCGGSGSTYIYGYLDSTYKAGMTEDECVEFVKKGVALAMSRDGSSGGCIRLGVISKRGLERKIFTGDDIPKFTL